MPVLHSRTGSRRTTPLLTSAKEAVRSAWLHASTMKSCARVFGAASLALLSLSSASAQTSTRYGVINRLELTEAGNFGFRVYLIQGNVSPLTDCGDAFAYIEPGHSNYGAITAMLMSNYIEKRPVALVIEKQTNGLCRINFVSN